MLNRLTTLRNELENKASEAYERYNNLYEEFRAANDAFWKADGDENFDPDEYAKLEAEDERLDILQSEAYYEYDYYNDLLIKICEAIEIIEERGT